MCSPAPRDAAPTGRDPFRVGPAAASLLARRLAHRIRAEGPITFAAFSEAALYDPDAGYYRSGHPTVGREGDFLTSPELHPLFGYAVAAFAAADWDARGGPDPYTLCDVGPGSGALMESALAWAAAQRPDFAAALHALLVEPDATARQHQRRRLGTSSGRIDWREAIATVRPLRGLVVANELLDAQPVHRLRWAGQGWRELFVDLDGDGGFRDRSGPVSDAALLEPLQGLTPAPGQIAEICPGLARLIGDLAAALAEGLLFCFDYGDRRARLYAPWRRAGTLMTFRRHTPGADPYLRIGEQDITCHVDVDTVLQAARDAGLQPYPVRSQAEWLAAMGATMLTPVASVPGGPELDDHLARRRAVQLLSDPAGLGRIQVMAFARGAAPTLPGIGAADANGGCA